MKSFDYESQVLQERPCTYCIFCKPSRTHIDIQSGSFIDFLRFYYLSFCFLFDRHDVTRGRDETLKITTVSAEFYLVKLP